MIQSLLDLQSVSKEPLKAALVIDHIDSTGDADLE
jgi:hypothetical protein